MTVATPKTRTPNLVLRRIRETERRESRQEFAVAVQNAGRQLGDLHLHCDAKQVARWEDGDIECPQPAYQRALSALLGRQFEALGFRVRQTGVQRQPEGPASPPLAETYHAARVTATDLLTTAGPAVADAQVWLDLHAGWPAGQARQRLSQALATLDSAQVEASGQRRGRVSQGAVASTLTSYYRPAGPARFYAVRCADRQIATSVLTRPQWLDLALPLSQGHDTIAFDPAPPPARPQLSEAAAGAAVRRLAEIIRTGTKLVNAPLYRLQQIQISPGTLTGTVGLTRFVDYALTLDLLEAELADAATAGEPVRPGLLPLRDEFLPDAEAMLDVGSRLCAGGTLALMAIARSSRSRRGKPPDYALLVQERSASVLNATGRLAVIPKAFHQPIVDYADDTQIAATIEREMEEELFGRPEVDLTHEHPRMADPMHPTRLSPPMRWLADHRDEHAWRIECTGFGINTISGNFEAAALIVIDNPSWWDEFGGVIQANWEAEGLRRYSSLDCDQVAALVLEPAWSNEGIFAFCQALRRLRQVGAERVCLPTIDLEDVSG